MYINKLDDNLPLSPFVTFSVSQKEKLLLNELLQQYLDFWLINSLYALIILIEAWDFSRQVKKAKSSAKTQYWSKTTKSMAFSQQNLTKCYQNGAYIF